MTNAVGPIIAYKYFRPLLEKGETKMIINFASNYGSITLASQPLKEPKKATALDHTQIAYKASKAAVNMGETSQVIGHCCMLVPLGATPNPAGLVFISISLHEMLEDAKCMAVPVRC